MNKTGTMLDGSANRISQRLTRIADQIAVGGIYGS